MYLEAGFLVTGLLGLWFSAKKTVENAENIIKSSGMPGFLFGAVFMSVSTGLPEIATAIISTTQGVPSLSAGDIIGSSLINMSLVLGLSIITAKTIKLHREDLELIRTASIATILAATALIIFQELSTAVIMILLTLYTVFLYRIQHTAFQIEGEGETSKKTITYTLLGVGTLLLSARLMVHGTEGIGQALGIPLELLGATVVAVGTGLPELAFEVTAIRKDDTSLAMGDIFGSTLVNITLILSALGIISTPTVTSLIPVLAGIVLVSALALIFSYRRKFSRLEGTILLAVFIGYIVVQVIQTT